VPELSDTAPGGDRIGELFDQALGEQAAEQRVLRQTITEVRGALVRIEELTGEGLREAVRTAVQATTGPAVDGALARGFGPGLAELRVGLDGVERRFDEVVRRLDTVSPGLSDSPLRVDLDALAISIASLRGAALTREDLPTPADIAAAVLPGLADAVAEVVAEVVTAAFDARPRALEVDDLREQRAELGEQLTEVHDAIVAALPVVPTANQVGVVVQQVLEQVVEQVEARSVQDLTRELRAAVAAEVGELIGSLPVAGAVRAEVAGALAGMRADLSEELVELVEDRLGELEAKADLGVLATLASREDLAAAVAGLPMPPPYSEDRVVAEVGALRQELETMRRLLLEELAQLRDADATDASDATDATDAADTDGSTQDLDPDEVRDLIRSSVNDAVAATELRLKAHMDEAVLALAEAVLTQSATPAPAAWRGSLTQDEASPDPCAEAVGPSGVEPGEVDPGEVEPGRRWWLRKGAEGS
jgi:hypothetical protein